MERLDLKVTVKSTVNRTNIGRKLICGLFKPFFLEKTFPSLEIAVSLKLPTFASENGPLVRKFLSNHFT